MTLAKANTTIPILPQETETPQVVKLVLNLPGKRKETQGKTASLLQLFKSFLGSSYPNRPVHSSNTSLNFTYKLYNLGQSQ